MMRKQAVLILILTGLVVLALAKPRIQIEDTLQPQPIELPVQPPAWLHVEVETSWGWFWQTSKGRAWVTAGKHDTLHVEVGKLCIQLQAHDNKQKCEYGKHEIRIEEKKRGVQIAKRTAVVTAWTEVPVLDPITVKMEP